MVDAVRDRARQAVFDRFAWEGGHADVWRVFDDGAALAAIVEAMVEPWRDADLAKVCAVEARGWVLGGAAASALGVGFVAIRKGGALFPGAKHRVTTAPDYRGREWELELQERSLQHSDRVLLVDDWIERGSQATAACELVVRAGGYVAGISVIVDQLDTATRGTLPPITSICAADELPPA